MKDSVAELRAMLRESLERGGLSEEDIERGVGYAEKLTELQARKLMGEDVHELELNVLAQIQAEVGIHASRVKAEVGSFLQNVVSLLFNGLLQALR